MAGRQGFYGDTSVKRGMRDFCECYADSFHRGWDDLGDAEITPETVKMLPMAFVQKVVGKPSQCNLLNAMH